MYKRFVSLLGLMKLADVVSRILISRTGQPLEVAVIAPAPLLLVEPFFLPSPMLIPSTCKSVDAQPVFGL